VWGALKSHSIEANVAVDRSRAAETWSRGRGAGHVPVQERSTFDSTDAGNIGSRDDGRCAPIPAMRACLVTPLFRNPAARDPGNLVRRSVPLTNAR